MGSGAGVRSQESEVRIKARTFQDVIAWQKAHKFVLGVYRYSSTFPRTETYGLTSQFRRAAVSIPANIAEGFRRRGKNEKVRFLNIAQSSLEECRYYLILSQDLEYGRNEDLRSMLEETSKVLDSYSKAILTPDSCLLTPSPHV
jgi:four helix bundle protein